MFCVTEKIGCIGLNVNAYPGKTLFVPKLKRKTVSFTTSEWEQSRLPDKTAEEPCFSFYFTEKHPPCAGTSLRKPKAWQTSLPLCNKHISLIRFIAMSSEFQIWHPVPYIQREILLPLTLNLTVTFTMLKSIYTTRWVIYCTRWSTSLLIPRSHHGSQVAAFVLHCETVFRCHVQRLPRPRVEVQLLDNDCQEEVDFIPCNDLANAAPLSHAKSHHLLPFNLVELGAIRTQEPVWVEQRWIFPQLTGKCGRWREEVMKKVEYICSKEWLFRCLFFCFSQDNLGAKSKSRLLRVILNKLTTHSWARHVTSLCLSRSLTF